MRSIRLFLIFAILLLSAACGEETLTPTEAARVNEIPVETAEPIPTEAPTAVPPATAQPAPSLSLEIDWPPALLSGSPQTGEELPVDGSITLRFDQPMDQESVAAALTVEDDDGSTIAGTIAWPQADTLTFTPDSALTAKTAYQLRLSKQARGENGLPLREPIETYFQTIGALEVTQVIPENKTTDVLTDNAITVIFNRPVVPLVSSGDQEGLPQPLSIIPETEGSGEWINSSLYRFTPAEPLAGATKYQVTVEPLSDLTGAAMDEPYSFAFSTIGPDVVTVIPAHESVKILPESVITVTFNMPMDTASTEAAIAFGSVNYTGDFEFSWSNDDRTVTIIPDGLLPLGDTYQLIINGSASSANGNAVLGRSHISSFTTIPYPAVISTNPEDNETASEWQRGFSVEFASPMDWETIDGRLTINPAPEEVEYYYHNDYLSLSFDMEASTEYTILIPGDAADLYGNTIGRDYGWSFNTMDAPPLATFNLTGAINQVGRDFPTNVDVIYRNVSMADIDLYDLGLNISLIQNPYNLSEYRPASDPIKSWSLPINLPKNQIAVEPVRLADGGALPSGFYMLNIHAPDMDEAMYRYWQNQRASIIVVDNNVVVKEMPDAVYVWVTGMTDGLAAADQQVRLYNEQGATIGTAVTDKNGFVRFDNPHDSDYFTGYTVVSGEPGAGFGVGSSGWTGNVSMWSMGIHGQPYPEEPTFSYLYGDRPIYRPGDTLYYKGIVRDADYGRYQPATERTVVLRLTPNGYSPNSTVDETIKVKLDEYGHFTGEFPLPDEIALGEYALYLDGPDVQQTSYTFTVADYRKPEFLIEMLPDETDVMRGTETAVSLQASYFAGGGVNDTAVQWGINARPYSPHFDGKFHYFGDGGSFFYETNSLFYGGYDDDIEYLGNGNGVTDENGHITIPLPSDLLDGVGEGSKEVRVETTINDLGEFPVTSFTTVIMHAADGYVGVVAQDIIADMGKETAVDLVTINWDGEPIPNRSVSVTFYQREWVSERVNESSIYYTRWTAIDTKLSEVEVTTGAGGTAEAPFTPEEGGSYIAVAAYTDEAGRTHTSSAPFWVYSAAYRGWRTDRRERSLELVADLSAYKAGDTAHILVQSPFPAPVQAWLTIERGNLIEQRLITLNSSSDTLDIPITAAYAPNVYVSLVIVKGVTESDYPWADIRFGAVNLPVSPEQLILDVAIAPQDEIVVPGGTAVYDITVTDYLGNPVQAELSLALVDLAVLSLRPDTTDIVEGFYHEQPYRSQTGGGLFISSEGLEVEIPLEGGGMGGGGGEDMAFAALAEVPESEDGSVRTDFRDTAYWEAIIQTDAAGTAHVEIDLPDNATTWRMSSKAISLPPESGSLVGQSIRDIRAALPLLIRPVTPRFFTAGDAMQIMATVQNNTDEPLETAVSLKSDGLTLAGEAAQTINIPPHDRELVQWSVTVEDVEFVGITFIAESGAYRDATKPSFGIAPDQLLPVYRYDGRDIVGTAGVLDEEARRVEAILLPDGVDTRRGTVETVLNGSLGAAIFESMDAREPYSWQTACASSVTDRLLPNTAVARAISELNLNETALQAELDALIPADIALLESLHTPDGGWGWCYSDKSNAWLTAYTLMALIQAEEAGYEDANSSARIRIASNYLAEELAAIKNIDNDYMANRQAFFLYVLARGGRDIIPHADALVDEHRSLLDPYGKAFLLMAYALNGADSPNEQTLLSDLNGAVIVSATGAHWEDTYPDYINLNSDVRGTAVIIQALSMVDPQNEMIPLAVRWLMSSRTAMVWATTHETAWSLNSLTDWAVASGDFEADYAYALLINGDEVENGRITADNLTESIHNSVPISSLSLTDPNYFDYQKQGEGNLYYTTHMDSYINAAMVNAVNRGINIERMYYDASCNPAEESCEPLTQITTGEKVRVVLDITAVNDLVYAIIEDPLPAGAEAIDPNLDTSPSDFGGGMGSNSSSCWGCWGWWYFNRIEYRDEKVVFMTNFLPAGTYRYEYTLQTNIPGTYQVMPTFGYETYFPEVNGRSDGMLFTIEE